MENRRINIMLDRPSDVAEFVNTTSNFPRNIELVASHGKYTVDARSIMGIFSLNLSEPITIEMRTDTDILDEYINKLSKWRV